MVSLESFKNNAYLVGALPSTTPPEQTYGVNDPHTRFRKENYYGHVVGNSNFPGIRKINIGPGSDTVYLPFYQNRVTSVHLPSSGPFFFVTDNMSGCAFGIAEYDDDSLVVFHANTTDGSSQAEMQGRKTNHQSAAVSGKLGGLIGGARKHHGGSRIVRTLLKSEYLSEVSSVAGNTENFTGGTTIAGWRNGSDWEFWYQNFGSVSGSASGLLFARKFYP